MTVSSIPPSTPFDGRPPSAAPTKAAEAAQQFEGILLRQFLSESMKSLLKEGTGGQVYGQLVTESLADSMTKAGGLGLSSIFQAAFTPEDHQ